MSGGERPIKWKAGDHWVVCERTGFTYRKSDTMREPKTGFIVGKDVVDMPHPQQYRTPVKPDKQAVYPVRLEGFLRTPAGFETNDVLTSQGYSYDHQQLPDETVSALPEIGGGSVDDTATGAKFVAVGAVDPNDVDISL